MSARLMVDLGAVRHNHASLAAFASGAECAAVVKADAYGLGMKQISAALVGKVNTFFVAHPEEGITLRKLYPDKTIFVLHGFLPGYAEVMSYYNLYPVLNSVSQVHNWQSFCHDKGYNYPAAIQFDTGMSRFGISESELHNEYVQRLKPVLVMSHLACADQPNHPANAAQRACFLRMSAAFPGVPRSLSASAGILLGKEYHFEMVRPGVSLYGLTEQQTHMSLRPAVGLEAQILQIREIPAGAAIGYGLTYCAERPTRVATVGIGYADGVFRSFAQKGFLWKGNVPLPVIGRISMDSLSVDITVLSPDSVLEGDWLTLIGPEQDLARMAEQAGTISYEILTSLGYRFDRFYQD
ncbi:alanine racemase [Bombella saccharophila]|uniref:Alanine racemase n=1 Tax=Bombella saccharophila TaxID=2967338 RepID=A0ABT3WB13_9PROT|nr:alanine racemase [Bombella saccharophila]MCX5614171.1 alanine racemase [Bombella saccharophila]